MATTRCNAVSPSTLIRAQRNRFSLGRNEDCSAAVDRHRLVLPEARSDTAGGALEDGVTDADASNPVPNQGEVGVEDQRMAVPSELIDAPVGPYG